MKRKLLWGNSLRAFLLWPVLAMSKEEASSSTVTFRRATMEDQTMIGSLVIQNHLALSQDFPEEYLRQVVDVPADFAHLINRKQFEKSCFVVAVDDAHNRIVGCAGIISSIVKADPDAAIVDFGEWELTGVTVAQSHRNRGLARTMIELLLQEVRDGRLESPSGPILGVCQRVHLVTLKERMAPACRLYESLGFQLEREEQVYMAPLMTVRHYTYALDIEKR